MARRYSLIIDGNNYPLSTVASDEHAEQFASGVVAAFGMNLRPLKWLEWSEGRRSAVVYGRKPEEKRSRYLGTLRSREVGK